MNSGKDNAMPQKDTDFRKIRKLIKIMQDNELVEVEIKHGDDKILLKRSQPQQIAAMPMNMAGFPGGHGMPADAGGQQAEQTKQEDDLVEIESPIVGTFYDTPSPDSAPFVEVGAQVGPSTVICIIEAMKVMNEIKAETAGEIVEILVTNGQSVEYGQPLFKVKPN